VETNESLWRKNLNAQHWVEVVPPCPVGDGKAAFEQWLHESGLDRSALAADEVRIDTGRWDRGSFVRYWVHDDALVRLGIKSPRS
jgi:hypothetical protein